MWTACHWFTKIGHPTAWLSGSPHWNHCAHQWGVKPNTYPEYSVATAAECNVFPLNTFIHSSLHLIDTTRLIGLWPSHFQYALLHHTSPSITNFNQYDACILVQSNDPSCNQVPIRHPWRLLILHPIREVCKNHQKFITASPNQNIQFCSITELFTHVSTPSEIRRDTYFMVSTIRSIYTISDKDQR